MNAILQSQFQRVEAALNTLIDSIAAYTPSPSAAVALIEADDELSKGLERLSTHQTNHATLLRLRQTSDALSDQITQVLSRLANVRAEVLATPATTFPEDSRDVPYDELLAYANKISKFTVPPTFRAPALAATSPASDDLRREGPQSPDGHDEEVLVVEENGNTTDYPNGGGEDQAGIGASSSLATNRSHKPEDAAVTARAPAPAPTTTTTSTTPHPFIPWPTDDTIRRGALATIQTMLEAGQDPSTTTIATMPSAPPDPSNDSNNNNNTNNDDKDDNPNGDDSTVSLPTRSSRPNPDPNSNLNPNPAAHVPPSSSSTARAEEDSKPAVFTGLDLWDPDDEE